MHALEARFVKHAVISHELFHVVHGPSAHHALGRGDGLPLGLRRDRDSHRGSSPETCETWGTGHALVGVSRDLRITFLYRARSKNWLTAENER